MTADPTSPGKAWKMLAELGHEEVVLIGFSRILLTALGDALPPGSVLVVEEPDVVAKRDIVTLAARHPSVSRVLVAEYQVPGAMAELLSTTPALKAVRAVVPGIEYAVEPAAHLAAALGLPGAGTGAAAVFRNKVRQRRAAAAAGLRNPAYEVVADVAAALAFFDRAGTRCILKPTARQASLGVQFVDTRTELETGFRHSRDADESLLVPGRGIRSELVIEHALDGAEYSVELLVSGGRTRFSNVTAKRVLPGRFPVELGHVAPGAPTEVLGRQLVENTTRLAEASGFGDGILHCEWIVDGQGPALVECAARMPGDEIATLVSLAYDSPLVCAYLEILLGSVPDLPATPRYGAAIRFLTAPPGTVTDVLGVAQARAIPGVQAVTVSATPGARVHPVTSSWDRLGYVITRADSASAAEQLALHAAETIRVQTDPA